MNKNIYVLFSIFALVFVFVSCTEDDDFPAPVISDLEIGYENSQVGYRGSELHIDANIVAEGRIDRIIIDIHHEGDDHDDYGWEFEYTWTKFNGLRNSSFHEHIDIPLNAELGDYHFYFTVIDMDGRVTEIKTEIEVVNPENTIAPVITVSSAPSDGEVFHMEDVISISGAVTHEQGLGGIYIGLVRVNQELEDAEVNASNTITLLYTHDFDSPESHTFDANITAGADEDNYNTPKPIEGEIAWQDGDYYILVKSRDAFGGPFGFSDRYYIHIQMD